MKLEIFRQETNGKAQIQDGNAKCKSIWVEKTQSCIKIKLQSLICTSF